MCSLVNNFSRAERNLPNNWCRRRGVVQLLPAAKECLGRDIWKVPCLTSQSLLSSIKVASRLTRDDIEWEPLLISVPHQFRVYRILFARESCQYFIILKKNNFTFALVDDLSTLKTWQMTPCTRVIFFFRNSTTMLGFQLTFAPRLLIAVWRALAPDRGKGQRLRDYVVTYCTVASVYIWPKLIALANILLHKRINPLYPAREYRDIPHFKGANGESYIPIIASLSN